MPPKRLTREEAKARTRSDLLKAAGRLFLRNGFWATSLSEIAEEAGLSKGAVYSNFESKEAFFLALMNEGDGSGNWARRDELAPSHPEVAAGRTAEEKAAAWGRVAAGSRPNARNVSLFLEMNAVALRNESMRHWVDGHNREFFAEVGEQLAEAMGELDADPELLGLFAQSLFVGLLMHGAFSPDLVDEDAFERFYALLPAAARAATR